MNLLAEKQLAEHDVCSLLPSSTRCDQYFLAADVSASELDQLLAEGWRKFGLYYFKPSCGPCSACTPLRIPVNDFNPNRSQKRVKRNGSPLHITFGPLDFNQRAFEIFIEHSRIRFGKEDNDLEQFMFNFYTPSCPGLQVSIFLEEELIGVGWLDQGEESLSSVYFCFDPKYSNFNLGTYSILAGIDYAQEQGLLWNYLGYFVEGNRSTVYKINFRPHEHYDWQTKKWQR